MAKQRQVASVDPEKPKTRLKDTEELATQLLEEYAEITTALGDLADLAEDGTRNAAATLKLYAQLVDQIADFGSLVRRLRTRVFKVSLEKAYMRFQEELNAHVKGAVSTMEKEQGPHR